MTETLGVYTSAAGNSDAMVATGGRDSFNTDIMYDTTTRSDNNNLQFILQQ